MKLWLCKVFCTLKSRKWGFAPQPRFFAKLPRVNASSPPMRALPIRLWALLDIIYVNALHLCNPNSRTGLTILYFRFLPNLKRVLGNLARVTFRRWSSQAMNFEFPSGQRTAFPSMKPGGSPSSLLVAQVFPSALNQKYYKDKDIGTDLLWEMVVSDFHFFCSVLITITIAPFFLIFFAHSLMSRFFLPISPITTIMCLK